jgi:nucleoside-diphosphate-sugar epimerase
MATPSLDAFRKCASAGAVAALFGPLDGRCVLVTGASSGFGLETALAIAANGGTTIMACRPGAKAEAAAAKVRAAAARGAAVHLLALDLARPASVRECAAAFATLRAQLPRGGALSALVLNAGILGVPFGAYAPDSEPQLQVNLLGHALLHELLRPALEAADDARVVVVASGSHYWLTGESLDLALELPPRRERFDWGRAYGFSNLCRILWARALSRRTPYPVVSLHPASGPPTDAGRNMTLGVLLSVLPRVLYHELRGLLEFQSVSKGTRTQLFAALAPRAAVAELNGKFLSGNETDGPLGSAVAPSAFAQREDYAEAVLAFVDAFVAREKA